MTEPYPAVARSLPPPPDDATVARPALLHRAPGWIFHLLATVAALALLWSESYPLGNFLPLLLGFWLTIGCAAVWLLRLIIYVSGRRAGVPSGRSRRFLIAPIGGFTVIALMALGVPLAARWGISRAAFDARADQLVAEAAETGADRNREVLEGDRVALYTVRAAWVDDSGGVYFVIDGSGAIDGGGLARLPDGPPPTGLEPGAPEEFEHLEGDWYTFVEPF